MDVSSAITSDPVRKVAWGIILVALTAAVSLAAGKALRRLLKRDEVPLAASSIFINITRATIWIIGASVLLDNCFHIKANAVVAALGVGGIAISLGCQDTFSNLIGGVQLSLLNLVKPGDNIEVGSDIGVVTDVTWRHTTIRDAIGQTIIIPNSVISKTAMVHLLPAGRIEAFLCVTNTKKWESLDELGRELEEATRAAVEPISPLSVAPEAVFTSISRYGVEGKVVFTIENDLVTTAALNAAVRAIAPIVGHHAVSSHDHATESKSQATTK